MMNEQQLAKHRERQRRWRAANREKHSESQRKWQAANRERALEVGRVSAVKRRERLRAELISAYGGSCTCCGESNPVFLTIEHIGGRQGRPRNEPVSEMARLKKAGWPSEVTLFCYNCNCGSWRNGGVCPHVEVVVDDAAS